MKKAVITGDIINSSKLNKVENKLLIDELNNLVEELDLIFRIDAELFRGDSIQFLIHDLKTALIIALLVKTAVKSRISSKLQTLNNSSLRGSLCDIRLAIGIGKVTTERDKVITSNGEAFSFSGHMLDEMKNNQTFAIRTNDLYNSEFQASFKLLDFIISRATQNQSEVIYYKLLGMTEDEISNVIGIKQSAVNQRSISSGWNAINSLIERFENVYE